MLVTENPPQKPECDQNSSVKNGGEHAVALPDHPDRFVRRHIGPSPNETTEMLKALGVSSMDELVDRAVPPQIRLNRTLDLPPARSEFEVLAALKEIASQNLVYRSF